MPVYVVSAIDHVESTDADTRAEASAHLRKACPLRHTAGLESILLLHEGAMVLSHGKDSHALGLMNGTELEVL